LPRELGLDEALGSQALHRFDDLQIGYVEFFMLRRVIVLLGNKDSLCRINLIHTIKLQFFWSNMWKRRTFEEVLVDNAPVLLGDNHPGLCVLRGGRYEP
jgi:hypothetical protein